MRSKQLVQGCYVVAWMGVELAITFELQGRTLTGERRLIVKLERLFAAIVRKWRLFYVARNSGEL